MNRTLVWPWHGMVRGSFVHLPNGDTVPYAQPTGLQAAIYGPGDTHLITVEGIEPITPEEAASAPPGGQYWAGQALITGSSLYNRPFQGWMFQAEDGSRWRASLIAGTIGAASTTVRVTLTRFGEFGVAAESFTTLLDVPVGQADGNMRRKLSGTAGIDGDVVVRLHSFSPSGRTAILAWSLFNRAPDGGSPDVDVRPRAYTFYKVSLERTESAVLIAGEVLYDFDAVYREDIADSESERRTFGPMEPPIETKREPIIEDGEYVGDTVTYDFSSVVTVVPGGQWNGPNNYEATRRWLVMIVFEDENPRPCYLNAHDTYARGEASFSQVTVTPMIIEKRFNQSDVIKDPGSRYVTGGGMASGQGTISWEGPGSGWSRTNSYSVSSSINDGVLTIVDTDGESVVVQTYENAGFQMWTDSGATWAGNGGGLPRYAAGWRYWSLLMYSNNLIAVTEFGGRDDQAERVQGVITANGYMALESPLVLPADVRNFGSYNPATDEFIILSLDRVNWI